MHEILFVGGKYEHGDGEKIMKFFPTNLAKKKTAINFPRRRIKIL
jgi:hypothetical protein